MDDELYLRCAGKILFCNSVPNPLEESSEKIEIATLGTGNGTVLITQDIEAP